MSGRLGPPTSLKAPGTRHAGIRGRWCESGGPCWRPQREEAGVVAPGWGTCVGSWPNDDRRRERTGWEWAVTPFLKSRISKPGWRPKNQTHSSFDGIGRVDLTKEANRPRLHRGDERSRGRRMKRKSGRQCRRGPS